MAPKHANEVRAYRRATTANTERSRRRAQPAINAYRAVVVAEARKAARVPPEQDPAGTVWELVESAWRSQGPLAPYKAHLTAMLIGCALLGTQEPETRHVLKVTVSTPDPIYGSYHLELWAGWRVQDFALATGLHEEHRLGIAFLQRCGYDFWGRAADIWRPAYKVLIKGAISDLKHALGS